MPKLEYEWADIGLPNGRFYTSPHQGSAARLDPEAYATARAAMPIVCLDALVCSHLDDGTRAVVLLERSDEGLADGPFRGEPWVMGGKWDMKSPLPEFMVNKVKAELFGNTEPPSTACSMAFRGFIGGDSPYVFGTGWGQGTDGPFGQQGFTVQWCGIVHLDRIDTDSFRPDRDHSRYLIVKKGDGITDFHPYIADVIALSEWLK